MGSDETEPAGQRRKKKRKGPQAPRGRRCTEYPLHVTSKAPREAGDRGQGGPGETARAVLWDGALHLAPAGGKGSPPPLWKPVLRDAALAVEAEAARSAALDKLRKLFEREAARAGCPGPLLAFERWRWAAVDGEGRRGGGGQKGRKARAPDDPVLPNGTDEAEPGLVEDLLRAGVARAKALPCARCLARASGAAAKEVRRHVDRLRNSALPAGSAGLVGVQVHKHSVDLSHGRFRVTLTHTAYGKVCALYRSAGEPPGAEGSSGPSSDAARGDEEGEVDWAAEAKALGDELARAGEAGRRVVFHQRLMAMLLRYKSIRGHGFQAAVGPQVFEVFQRFLGCSLELFGSPLNAHFNRHCSAFPDVDAVFGSCGSAFAFRPAAGSYEANPPFTAPLLDRTAAHLEALLADAAAGGRALAFVAVFPGWRENAGWQQLSGSVHLEHAVVVAAADHGFCDGASHQRRDPYRDSPYDGRRGGRSGGLTQETDTTRGCSCCGRPRPGASCPWTRGRSRPRCGPRWPRPARRRRRGPGTPRSGRAGGSARRPSPASRGPGRRRDASAVMMKSTTRFLRFP